ncbi:unnamed protein product, partial [marine sediment metagenome]
MPLRTLYDKIAMACAKPLCGSHAKSNRCSSISYQCEGHTETILKAWQEAEFFHLRSYPIRQSGSLAAEPESPVYPNQVDVLLVAMEANIAWRRFPDCKKVKRLVNDGFVNFYGVAGKDRWLELMLFTAFEIFG